MKDLNAPANLEVSDNVKRAFTKAFLVPSDASILAMNKHEYVRFTLPLPTPSVASGAPEQTSSLSA